jgi:hypothetical protein
VQSRRRTLVKHPSAVESTTLHNASRTSGSGDPEITASSNAFSPANKDSARFRSSISECKTYQRPIRPSGSRNGKPCMWNHRYTPSARRIRCSMSYEAPVSTECFHEASTRERSSGCTSGAQFFNSSSVAPKYSRT